MASVQKFATFVPRQKKNLARLSVHFIARFGKTQCCARSSGSHLFGAVDTLPKKKLESHPVGCANGAEAKV
jgi:hypothetical protein